MIVGEAALRRDVDDQDDFSAKRLETNVVAVDVDCRQVVKRRPAERRRRQA